MDAKEEIKDRLDVDEVIGGYLQLKPSGANLKGICPFHHEKTPSLMVSPEKGIWHCFGCGEGGDIFTFVMKMEGIDFREALERLAQKAGVELPASGSGKRENKLKEQLYPVMELATKYYQAVYDRSKTAQTYVKGRGFNAKTIKDWRVGYAPTTEDSLVSALGKRGAKPAHLIKAGLARKRGNKLVDLFRNRLLIPLADSQGRPIGFTGRVLDEGMPKYLNTPQTPLFDKSRFVFGFHLARDAIRSQDQAVIAEGNLDVLASHQAGQTNVVATSGTALTRWQLKSLSHLTHNIKLAFDKDAAGLAATERAIPLAQELGLSLYIVELGEAKDPDDLIKTDPKAWEAAISKAPYVIDWLLEALQGQYELASVPGKKRFSDRILAVVAKLNDPVEQEHYAKALAKLIEVSPESVMSKLSQTDGTKPQPTAAAKPAEASEQPLHSESAAVEEALLAVVVTYADTRVSLQDLTPEHFTTHQRQQLFEYLIEHADADLTKKLPKSLHTLENYVKILLLQGEEQFKDWAALDRRIEAFGLASRLQTLFIKQIQKQLAAQLKTAEASGNTKAREAILKEFRDLARKLN